MVSGKGYGDGLRHLIFGENLTGESRNLYHVSGVLGMKKVIYILLTIFLCLMLLFILNAVVAIPTWVQYVLLIVGTVGGYALGQHWWRVVYVQRRHWYFRMKDRNENKESPIALRCKCNNRSHGTNFKNLGVTK